MRNRARFSLHLAVILLVTAGSGFYSLASARTQERAGSRQNYNGRHGRHRYRGLVASGRYVRFGNVGVGTTATHTLTVTNVGTADVTITNASTSTSSFVVAGLLLPQTLLAGMAASFQVQFTPQTAGSVQGILTLNSNAVDSTLDVGLVGNGAQGQLTVTPPSVNFGTVAGGATASQTVVVTNTGTAPLNVIQASVSGAGFTLGGMPLPMLMAGTQSASFTVTFAPQSPGNARGTLTLTCDGPAPVTNIPLLGIGGGSGWGQLTANPNNVNFGAVADGTTSSQTIRLTNTGTGSLVVLNAGVTGAGLGMTGLPLPTTLASGQSTTFNAQFAPQSPGGVTGNISLVTDVVNSQPTLIPLAATGVAASLQLSANPSSVNFGNVNVGSNSSQTVSLTNTGNTSLQVSGVSASGKGFTASASGLPVTLNASQSLAVAVVFAPLAQGPATGNVTVTSTASNSPTVALSGAGVVITAHSASLTWDPSTSTVAGYNVYRGSVSGGPYAKLTSSLNGGTAYTDSSVQSGTTYYYVVTAVDSSGSESAYSNEAAAAIP